MTDQNQKQAKGALAWLSLAMVIIVIDQWSKFLIQKQLELYDAIPVIPFFSITHWHNKGVAFSLFEDAGPSVIWVFAFIALVISVVIVSWLYNLPKDNKWLACALALVLGGAVGNMLDRLFHGYVIDFLLFHWGDWSWPAFNMADSAICVGVAMLIIDMFRK